MKVLCAEYVGDKMTVYPIGDSALLRENGDFYIPDFTEDLSCVPQFVVKIDRLGKSVAERFASRYYSEFTVGLRFYADTLEKNLKADGLPYIAACSFNHSAVLSELRAFQEGAELKFYVNDEMLYSAKLESSKVDKLIEYASKYFTIKISDYLYCGAHSRYKVLMGDTIKIALNDEILVYFKIQ